MNKRFYLIAWFLTLSLPSLLAQSADVPASREDVLKLFHTMNLHEQMRQVMESVFQQQRTMMHESLKKRAPQITDEELARLDRLSSDVLKDLPTDTLLDDMIPVYQKHLTRSDVDAMNTFYASPTGQKLMREMPAMTAESMQAAAPHMQAMMDKVMDRAEQMEKEERQRSNTPKRTGKE